MSHGTRVLIDSVGREAVLEAVNFSGDPNYWLQLKGIGPTAAYYLSQKFEIKTNNGPSYQWYTNEIAPVHPKLTRAEAAKKFPDFNISAVRDQIRYHNLFSGKRLSGAQEVLTLNQLRAILDKHKVTGSETPNELLAEVRNGCYELGLSLEKLKNRGYGDATKDSIRVLIESMSKYT